MRIVFETVLLIAWVGFTVVAGYVVAPLLFAELPARTAGDIMGILFGRVSLTGMVAIVGLWFSGCLKKGFGNFFSSFKSVCLLAALLLIAINEWLITPVIVALKTGGSNILHTAIGGGFAAWHGASQIVYLLTVICALVFTFLWSKNLRG